jgi:ATP-binding cassette, subfamily F, member 3
MADPEVYTNGEKCKAVQKEIDELDCKINELNDLWEKAAEKLEEYK